MIYRETNPPLGLMSKASIFHAPAGTQNSDGDTRRLAVIGTPWSRRLATVKVSGGYRDEPPTHPHSKLAITSLSRSDDVSEGRPGKRNNPSVVLTLVLPMMLLI